MLKKPWNYKHTEYRQDRADCYVALLKSGTSHALSIRKSCIRELEVRDYLEHFPEMNEAYHAYCDRKKVPISKRKTPIRLFEVKAGCKP